MKINNEKINELASLSDTELWCEIKKIAGSHGFKLPDKTPSPEEMTKLRAAICGGAKINLTDAVRIINNYRRGQK